MAAQPPPTPPAAEPPPLPPEPVRKRRRWRRWLPSRRIVGGVALLLLAAAVIGRTYLAEWTTRYVNYVIDQNELYDGQIDGIDLHLYRGNYSIHNVRLLKRTGNVAEPFFACERLDVSVDWPTLLRGKVKAAIYVERPEINFVEGPTESQSQTGSVGGGGPWLGILKDLAPFDINSAVVHAGAVHFQAHHRQPQVDLVLDRLNVSVRNLTNVQDALTPLNATVDVTGKAMESGDFECHVKFNPFSYNPTFELALKLLRLDVNKLNDFTKAYGDFDFENGYFDLVVELNSKEGLLDGYVRPLFRNVQIFGRRDLSEDIFNVFWQALLGTGEFVLRNQGRDQFGTQIPVAGNLKSPEPDILPTVLNVLRNAFVRAYVPRLSGSRVDLSGLDFAPGTVAEPGKVD